MFFPILLILILFIMMLPMFFMRRQFQKEKLAGAARWRLNVTIAKPASSPFGVEFDSSSGACVVASHMMGGAMALAGSIFLGDHVTAIDGASTPDAAAAKQALADATGDVCFTVERELVLDLDTGVKTLPLRVKRPPPETSMGVQLASDAAARVVVQALEPSSLLARAGLLVGDVLLKVDTFTPKTASSATNILRAPGGHFIELTITRPAAVELKPLQAANEEDVEEGAPLVNKAAKNK